MAVSWKGKHTIKRWGKDGSSVGASDTIIVPADATRVRLLITVISSNAMQIYTGEVQEPSFDTMPLIRAGSFVEFNADDDPDLVTEEWHAKSLEDESCYFSVLEVLLMG